MRSAILAAILATGSAAALAGLDPAAAAAPQTETAADSAAAVRDPAPALAATAPPQADPARTYEEPMDALLEADLDFLAREAQRADVRGDGNSVWPTIRFMDAFAAGRFADARAVLASSPEGLRSGTADLFEPFLLSAEGHADRGVARVNEGLADMPAPLPDMARGLVFESAGRLEEAAAVYAQMLTRIDLTPPPESEPSSVEEYQRLLNANRVTHAVYRAALVDHRLGRTASARRLYEVVKTFAPRSADVERNLQRLAAGQGPLEPALDPRRAVGRWLFFISEYMTQSETLAQILSNPGPVDGLVSPSGTLLLQLGLALDGSADDWRLYAADQLVDAEALGGAQRLLAGIATDGPFAPDAELSRAAIHLEQEQDDAAVAAADRALRMAGDRWPVIASAGDVYRSAGRTTQAVSAFDRALTLAQTPKDRADILGWRAYAHRFAGDIPAATADARAALALHQGDNIRLLYVSILMDDPAGWQDGVQMARALFAEQPDSVSRLNALGYALIQRPEGLEEGYRLLWRGFNFGQSDYAVVDSLGWAYYLYGHFEQARALIERANDLTGAAPNSEILDHLGDVYWRLDRREEARDAWRQAIAARPDMVRRRSLDAKVARGLSTAAPRERALPEVNLPTGPRERGAT